MAIEIPQALESSPDSLFRTHTLHEITDLSQSLTTAAQEKHNELRNLVASQYRDLLNTADQIIAMNEVAKRGDRGLYNLSFMSNPRLNKIMQFESSISKWRPQKEVVLSKKAEEVEKKAELFLEMSKFLNLSEKDSVETIETVLTSLPVHEAWFKEKKAVVDKKVSDLQRVVLAKVETMSLEELVKIDEFAMSTTWFDRTTMEDTVYGTVVRLVTLENLRIVLSKLSKFTTKLEEKYKSQLEVMLQDLHSLMDTIEDKGNKLELYQLDLDDDYLQKIEFLTNGLLYEKYQKIATDIKGVLETLKFVEEINKDLHQGYIEDIKDVVAKFKTQAEKDENKPLVIYLSGIL